MRITTPAAMKKVSFGGVVAEPEQPGRHQQQEPDRQFDPAVPGGWEQVGDAQVEVGGQGDQQVRHGQGVGQPGGGAGQPQDGGRKGKRDHRQVVQEIPCRWLLMSFIAAFLLLPRSASGRISDEVAETGDDAAQPVQVIPVDGLGQ
jgi:hypothetical protein